MGHRDRDKMGSRDMETVDNTDRADNMDKVDNMDSRIHREDHHLYSRYSVLPARAAIHSRHTESTLYAATYICHDTHNDTPGSDTCKIHHYMYHIVVTSLLISPRFPASLSAISWIETWVAPSSNPHRPSPQ
jgi:hypothetical protein